MTLKTKLTSGLAFLFLIIFALAIFCSYYVGRMGQESQNILKDNYRSLVYARNMLGGLDDMKTSMATMLQKKHGGSMSDYYSRLLESGKKLLDANRTAENNNITEISEKESVEKLNRDYEAFLRVCGEMKNSSGNIPFYLNDFIPASERLKQSINVIYDINMQAVVRKSELARHDASTFVTAMAIIGAFCLLLALGYFWYFPVYVSTTLSYLSNKMRALLKGAGVSLDETTNDEAYLILHGMNLLENKLGLKARGENEKTLGR